MTKFVHIVYVHPVENGEPNLHKVLMEREFDNKWKADNWITSFNEFAGAAEKAVYYGCVNDATGELV
jgi:hypothetical protein